MGEKRITYSGPLMFSGFESNGAYTVAYVVDLKRSARYGVSYDHGRDMVWVIGMTGRDLKLSGKTAQDVMRCAVARGECPPAMNACMERQLKG